MKKTCISLIALACLAFAGTAEAREAATMTRSSATRSVSADTGSATRSTSVRTGTTSRTGTTATSRMGTTSRTGTTATSRTGTTTTSRTGTITGRTGATGRTVISNDELIARIDDRKEPIAFEEIEKPYKPVIEPIVGPVVGPEPFEPDIGPVKPVKFETVSSCPQGTSKSSDGCCCVNNGANYKIDTGINKIDPNSFRRKYDFEEPVVFERDDYRKEIDPSIFKKEIDPSLLEYKKLDTGRTVSGSTTRLERARLTEETVSKFDATDRAVARKALAEF